MKIKRYLALFLAFILLFIASLNFDYKSVSNRLSKMPLTDVSLYIKRNNNVINTKAIAAKTVKKEEFYKYEDIEKRAIDINLKEVNKNLEIVDLSLIEDEQSKENVSIEIDYNDDIKPSSVQIIIQSKDDDLYYWEYELNDDKFLKFALPIQILEKEGNYYIQANIIWTKINKTLLNRQYNFNIEI